MSFVFVYGFKGIFSGSSEYEYRFPKKAIELKSIIFIRQDSDQLDLAKVEDEISKYGFISVHSLEGNLLKVESLNSSGGKRFQPFYEEALETGSSIAIY